MSIPISSLRCCPQVSFSLDSLKGGIGDNMSYRLNLGWGGPIGNYIGFWGGPIKGDIAHVSPGLISESTIGPIKGDTRNLNHGSGQLRVSPPSRCTVAHAAGGLHRTKG